MFGEITRKISNFASDYSMQLEIIISNTTDLLRVSALDIICIKAEGNYSTIVMNDGEGHLVLFQLGQLEQLINEQLGADASLFIRVGRGVIINREYLYSINLPKQSLVLRAPSGYKEPLTVSRESLRQLKIFVDSTIRKGGKNGDDEE